MKSEQFFHYAAPLIGCMVFSGCGATKYTH